MHPALFGLLYYLSSKAANIFELAPASHADLMIAMPKVLQATISAAGDFYSWRLAGVVYGEGTAIQWTAVSYLIPIIRKEALKQFDG